MWTSLKPSHNNRSFSSPPLLPIRLSTSLTRNLREELESLFNPALGGSRVHSTYNTIPAIPDIIGQLSFYVTKNNI